MEVKFPIETIVRSAVVPEAVLLQDRGGVLAREPLGMDFGRRPARHGPESSASSTVRANPQNRPLISFYFFFPSCSNLQGIVEKQSSSALPAGSTALAISPGTTSEGQEQCECTNLKAVCFTLRICVPSQYLVCVKFVSCKMLVPSTVTDFSDNRRSPVTVKWSLNIKGSTALLSQSGIVSASLAGKKMSGLNLSSP